MSLTQPFDAPERAGAYLTLGVAAATTIYAGAMVAANATGNAVPATDTAGLTVVGRAEETVDNSAGIAGAVQPLTDAVALNTAESVMLAEDGAFLITEDNNLLLLED